MGGMMGGGGGGSSGAQSSPAPAPTFDQSGNMAMENALASANAKQGTPLQTPQNPLTQIAPMFQGANAQHPPPGVPGGGGMSSPPPAMGNSNPMMQAFQSGMNPFGG